MTLAGTEPSRPRRRYHSPLRRQQAADTRARIVDAGAELLHGYPIWDWRPLTVPAVAERAGISTRTVYRYFPSERELRDAVLDRLEEESGVDLANLSLDDVPDAAERIFESVASFPLEPRTPRDPTVMAANRRQRAALVAALEPFTGAWSDSERVLAAAVLDVLWSPVSYERLVGEWGVEQSEAVRAIKWVIGLIDAEVRAGRGPRG